MAPLGLERQQNSRSLTTKHEISSGNYEILEDEIEARTAEAEYDRGFQAGQDAEHVENVEDVRYQGLVEGYNTARRTQDGLAALRNNREDTATQARPILLKELDRQSPERRPQCAPQYATLAQAEANCIPSATLVLDQITYQSCFCNSALLIPLKSSGAQCQATGCSVDDETRKGSLVGQEEAHVPSTHAPFDHHGES